MVMKKIPKLKHQLNSPIQQIKSPDSIQLQINGCKPFVKVGDIIEAGLLVAKSEKVGAIERRIHSPFKGEVMSITLSEICIKGDWVYSPEECKDFDFSAIDPNEIIDRCRLAGVVGMGGAMTPTHMKLIPGGKIDTILVNISESEPFLTCDHRVLEESPEIIESGLQLAMIATGAAKGIIAPKLKSYTSGYERFLVEETLGRKVPSGSRPTDVGVVVLNLQTVYALYLAVIEHQPLVQRVITVDGDAIKRPGNYLVPIGTKVGDILAHCGWDENISKQIIIGGPMMGDKADINTSVTAGTGGVLALTTEQTAKVNNNPCFRCGLCMEVCPLGLPAGLMERNPSADLLECIACGACQFVCPAGRPVLENIQKAKNKYIKKQGSNK
jgi:electron transport complex protein RnfC